MSCKLLIQFENKLLKIIDLYFGIGNRDGVDTIVTGHPSVGEILRSKNMG